MKKVGFLIAGGLIILVLILFFATQTSQTKPGRLDDFAKCLKDKGAIFYGAFWCPHCQNQKKIFEGSDKYLNYVECSTPDGQGQTQICKDKHIEGYPTWEFANGASASGELSLKDLSDRTGCPLSK